MDIHRGDAFDTLVSMSTASLGLNEYAKAHYPDSSWVNQKFALGDVNVCMIKTKLGKTILCSHDTNLPRPYSRDFLVQGTKGLVQKYPSELVYIEGKSKPHEWQDLADYSKDYEHPVWKQLREKSAGAGHGGMDFIEDWRLIQALRKGLTPDIDVYDSVAWSVIIPLSEQSVAAGGKPVKFTDFTRGLWKQQRPLQVDTHPDCKQHKFQLCGHQFVQLRQRAPLNLADALSRLVEFLTDLLECQGFFAVKPEPQTQDFGFARVDLVQQFDRPAQFFIRTEIVFGHLDFIVFDGIIQPGVVL
jgi:hypothetical protein